MKVLEPLGNNVLVQTRETPKKSGGGIHLPEQYQQPPGEGIVMAVGPGKMDYAGRWVRPGIRAGEMVIFNWLHARDVTDGKNTFKVIDVDQLLAVKREVNATMERIEPCLVDSPMAV